MNHKDPKDRRGKEPSEGCREAGQNDEVAILLVLELHVVTYHRCQTPSDISLIRHRHPVSNAHPLEDFLSVQWKSHMSRPPRTIACSGPRLAPPAIEMADRRTVTGAQVGSTWQELTSLKKPGKLSGYFAKYLITPTRKPAPVVTSTQYCFPA